MRILNMVSVSSSNLSSVGYENGTLYIAFRAGGLYAYYNVPENVFNALMSASSHGKFFSQFIKNRYRYKRIR